LQLPFPEPPRCLRRKPYPSADRIYRNYQAICRWDPFKSASLASPLRSLPSQEIPWLSPPRSWES